MSTEQELGTGIEWAPVAPPMGTPLRGRHVVLRRIDAERDAQSLYEASHPPDGDRAIWTYLPEGPFESPAALRQSLEEAETSADPLRYTIARASDDLPVGTASYLRITPAFGVIEIGHIWFGTPLRRTTGATEAIFLLARHAFDDLGYRRLEWKCNALNIASRRAAERFGFTFEGVFRQHQVIKGRNRDTAWFSIVDGEWPAIRSAFEAWLKPENFDAQGVQRRSLGELRVNPPASAPRPSG